LLGEQELTAEDFKYLCVELTAAFGENYIDPNNLAHQKALQVFRIATNEGLASSEFQAGIVNFIKQQIYPNWTPGNFFKSLYRSQLHPDTWVVEELKKLPGAKQFMEGYEFDIDGRKTTLWRYATGRELPFKKVYPKPKVEMVVDSTIPDVTDDDIKNMNWAMEAMDAKQEAKDAKEQLEFATKRINELEQGLAEYQTGNSINPYEFKRMAREIKTLIEGTIHLQGKIGKMRYYITESIKEKSTLEQIQIWNSIWENK